MKFSIRKINEWLIVLLLLILVPAVLFFIRGDVNFLSGSLHYLFNTRPSTVILSFNTMDAIAIFGGDAPTGYSITWKTVSMYLNVVLYLMVGPYLLFIGYKEARENDNRAKPWYWYIGAAIFIGLLSIVPAEITRMYVFENTKEAAEKSRTKDLMRAELVKVGFATAQYEILKNGVDKTFKIEDLNMDNLKYEHTIESIQSDTLLKISVLNPDQADDVIKMEVRPYDENIVRIRN